jgi:hypothetical protein
MLNAKLDVGLKDLDEDTCRVIPQNLQNRCCCYCCCCFVAVSMFDVKLDVGLKDLDEDTYRVNLKDITCSFTSDEFRKVAIKEAADGAQPVSKHMLVTVTCIIQLTHVGAVKLG